MITITINIEEQVISVNLSTTESCSNETEIEKSVRDGIMEMVNQYAETTNASVKEAITKYLQDKGNILK